MNLFLGFCFIKHSILPIVSLSLKKLIFKIYFNVFNLATSATEQLTFL